MADNKENKEDEEKKKSSGENTDQGKDKGGDKDKFSDNSQQPPPTWLEWTVRGVSLLLVLFCLGYFFYSASLPETMPKFVFEVQQDKIEQRGGQWAVPVDVTNDSGASVHALTITATLTGLEDEPEETLTVTLLGPNEEITTTFWFDEDPRGKGLEMSTGAYLLP